MKKKQKILIGSTILVSSLIGMLCYLGKETITWNVQGVIVHPVYTELDQDATVYLNGMRHPEQAKVDFSKVDVKKLGKYTGIITYQGKAYEIAFHVMDVEKPVIQAEKQSFTFSLDTSLTDINANIHSFLTVMDNYDQDLKLKDVVSTLPKEASTQTYTISIQDTSGNTSKEVDIKVTYTKPEETTNSNTIPVSNGSQTSSSLSSTNNAPSTSDVPVSNVLPEQVDYEKEIIIPSDALDGGVFDTEEAGEEWAFSIVNAPDSTWKVHGIRGTQYRDGKWRYWIEIVE